MRNDLERLGDMFEAIGRIEKYAERGRSVFERDELLQNWMIHHRIRGRSCLSAFHVKTRG